MNRLLILCLPLCCLAVIPLSAQMGMTTGGTVRKLYAPPGGPGSSYQRAIPITAPDETSGVKSEYAYLTKNFPGSKPINHSRESYTGRTYDVITFTTSGGQKRTVFFTYMIHRQ
jgi:hypothetical protein